MMPWTQLAQRLDAIDARLRAIEATLEGIAANQADLARRFHVVFEQPPLELTAVSSTDDDDWLRHFLDPRRNEPAS